MKKKNVFENAQNGQHRYMLFVDPLGIDRSKFTKYTKVEPKQRAAQELIIEAFAELDKHPEKYARPFYIIIPDEKGGTTKKVEQLKEYAKELSGEILDWVEMALGWAQMIDNGEWWDRICNGLDPINCQRIVLWKSGYYRLVGFRLFSREVCSMTDIYYWDYGLGEEISYTVPMVKGYEIR